MKIPPPGLKVLLVAAITSVGSSAALAQTSPLYSVDGDKYRTAVFQGGSLINSWLHQNNLFGTSSGYGEYAVAVSGGTVRQMANGNCGYGITSAGCQGSEYTTGGTYTGTQYAYPFPGCYYDGATDGTNNYAMNYCQGGVYKFGLDWSAPTLLFSTSAQQMGITYDPGSNSIWTASFGSGSITQWSMTGSVLSSFASSSIGGLAMDYADGTLWGVYGSTMSQYSTTGTLLTQVSTSEYNPLSAEFEISATTTTTPEPATVVLLASGLLIIGSVARRRRANAA